MATVTLRVVSWLGRTFVAREAASRSWSEAVAEGSTVRDLFERLAAENPGFASHVFDRERRELMGHVNVIYNDRLLDLAGGLDTVVVDGDTLTLLPSYAGG